MGLTWAETPQTLTVREVRGEGWEPGLISVGTGRALLSLLPLPIVLPQLETQLPELGGQRAKQPDFSSVFETVPQTSCIHSQPSL